MNERTLGWVQNPSSFENLKNVVSVFESSTFIYSDILNNKIPLLVKEENLKQELINELKRKPLHMKYTLLKGKGIEKGEKRKEAKCSGIIQATITTQKGREYTDDWTADGFLRWAISIGLLTYDVDNDEVFISELGKKFINSKNKEEENKILKEAFLSYPPAVRILNLLKDGNILTKFEIGKQLGGLGETGFTSIPQDLYIQAIETAEISEKAKIRSNTEGSADKYARMICGWLSKVDLVQKIEKEVLTKIGKKEYKVSIGHSFKITLEGLKELKSSKGTSSYKKIEKIVYWQMLATKGQDRDYIRNRRATIIKAINKKPKTISEIIKALEEKDIIESEVTIRDELLVIEAIGLEVSKIKFKKEYKYNITDSIVNLKIPKNKIKKTDLLVLKDTIREKLVHLNHRYLGLIDLAYDSNSDRDFEIQTIDLLVNELEFKGLRLGESRKPDGIVYYKENGVIIDNKAYKDGYNLPIGQADEMIRYIEENKIRDEKINPNKWWENFDENVKEFYYLFISSFFKGNYKKNLELISNRTGVNGGVISVENLLYLAEKIKSEELSYSNIFKIYRNDEINL